MEHLSKVKILPETELIPIAARFSGNKLVLLYVKENTFGSKDVSRVILLEAPHWEPFDAWGWTFPEVVEPAIIKHGYIPVTNGRPFKFKNRKEEIKKLEIELRRKIIGEE
jgi:hypothetical protein